ncbi:MAG: FadR family transcriptional regulator [Desulfobacteraceae bacterium]|nr:FadR family transcriptional regulator [Desulfobacteraceae bacterium]
MENKFEKMTIKKSRISDKIIEVLEHAVLDGSLKQGEKLPTEEKLAAQFKVSKVAVREALREMETRGLIRKKRGMYGGNFVSAPDVKKVGDSLISCFQFGTLTKDEIIDFRQTLEPVLIKKAARLRTKKDLAAMKANIEACERDLIKGRTNVSIHIGFHILIAKACHNKLFVAVMEAIAEIFEDIAKSWQEDKEKMRRDIEFNHKFYDCLLHRREEEAEKLMKAHFELTKLFRQEDLEKAAKNKK